MWVCLILIMCITFCYNVICVSNDVCGCLCVQYKYNIILRWVQVIPDVTHLELHIFLTIDFN